MDRQAKGWDIPTVQAVKVDSKQRLRLNRATPGDYYVPCFKGPDLVELRRVPPPTVKRKLTAKEVRAALDKGPGFLPGGYAALRAETREA